MKFTDFLNEKSFVPMSSDDKLGNYIIETLNIVSQFHVFHWLSISGQKHTTLGDFYNTLQDELDELAEMYISIGGVLKPTGYAIITEYSDEMVREALQALRNKTSICIDSHNSSDFKSIQDELIDIQELIDKTMYRFDLE